jgi:pimeloyl-ACP methyl ester carboxylesterase
MPVRMRHNRLMFAALPILITILVIFAPTLVLADGIISEPPEQIAPDTHYVFYLHGQIVQEVGPRPTHPRYGLYDYPLILEALAAGGITVISKRREPGTRPEEYAKLVAKQVKELLALGADPGNVTVVGFSLGGVITIRTSSLLDDTDINFVILAGCWDWIEDEPKIRLHGHVLSVFEESDQTTSCDELAERAPQPLSFEEFSINTGKEHGAFYLPNDEWLDPVLAWIQRQR